MYLARLPICQVLISKNLYCCCMFVFDCGIIESSAALWLQGQASLMLHENQGLVLCVTFLLQRYLCILFLCLGQIGSNGDMFMLLLFLLTGNDWMLLYGICRLLPKGTNPIEENQDNSFMFYTWVDGVYKAKQLLPFYTINDWVEFINIQHKQEEE